MTRRLTLAFTVFAAGVVVGLAIRRPAHTGQTTQERDAARVVATASGGHVVRVSCDAAQCGVVVHRSGATRCEGWIVPLHGAALGTPARAAFADC